jgi:hypothetical protein
MKSLAEQLQDMCDANDVEIVQAELTLTLRTLKEANCRDVMLRSPGEPQALLHHPPDKGNRGDRE